jgi:hypothetical protein
MFNPRGRNCATVRKMMDAAVASGEVDVIAGTTSDGLIAKYDLVALDDPRHAIPPYDAIVLLAPNGRRIRRCAGRSGRCWGRLILPPCARRICVRLAGMGRVRRMQWRGGCGRRLGGGSGEALWLGGSLAPSRTMRRAGLFAPLPPLAVKANFMVAVLRANTEQKVGNSYASSGMTHNSP